jgi:hypothetical protein
MIEAHLALPQVSRRKNADWTGLSDPRCRISSRQRLPLDFAVEL